MFGLVVLALMGSVAFANPEGELALAGQAIADEIRSTAGAQIAFIATGQIRGGGKSEDLSTFVQFGTDQVAVLNLTGKQIRSALERSVMLYPNANPGFLQVSGLEATFRKAKGAERVTSVSVNGSELQNDSSYTVAMPESLASGSFGYFTIWERTDSTRILGGRTLLSLTSGKALTSSPLRWRVSE
jgi:hypothetical protein